MVAAVTSSAWLGLALAALLSASGSSAYDECMSSCSASHSDCQARCRRHLPPRRTGERRGRWGRCVATTHQNDRDVDRDADCDADGLVVLGDDMTTRRR